MTATIEANGYCDEAVFARELEVIFSRTWLFAGFLSSLRNHNDWIVTEVAGKSLVVQNFQGTLRCFLNVCSHRFAQIRLTPEGNGPLRCSYHGWTYDSEGIPTGIPHRPKFEGLTPECVQSLGLSSYRVECCGEFVFVCLSPSAPDLASCMASFFDEVASLSTNMGNLIDTSEWELACNWKILVESTLESYHLDFVHPTTFSRLNAKFGNCRFDSISSSDLGTMNMEESGVRRFTASFPSRPRHTEGYYHFSMFPLFLMSTSFGIVYSVQLIQPLSPGRSFMKSFLFHREADPGGRMTAGMLSLLHESAIAFNRQVLSEDQAVCESAQKGAAQKGSQTGLLSEEEKRIVSFHRVYASFVSPDEDADGGTS